MTGEEMREMVDRGWGVGNHSWSHEVIGPDMLDRELREAREALEEAIDGPVDLYCSPGNNTNMADHVLAACREYGYLGAMSLTDALNRPGDELFWLNRTALHDQFYEPFYSEFDPYPEHTSTRRETADGSSTIATVRWMRSSTGTKTAPQNSFAGVSKRFSGKAGTTSGARFRKKPSSTT